MSERIPRTRNWGTIVYPESAPEDWIDMLKSFNVPFFLSPLHDQDLLEDGSGNLKKPHYHVLLMFDGVKTADQAAEIFQVINGVGVEKISSLRGNARYLCHLDDPDKAQYDPNDVFAYGPGADYVTVIALPTDKYDSISEMIDWCDREKVISYAQLLRYAREHNEIWFRVLCDSGTLVMKEFIKSRTWEATYVEYGKED
ncbi:MAG: replication protein [Lachnospiraceae bacterium]|nr:replication protein [Lachnospiraceae bacterium]